MKEEKLSKLLNIVIENYIFKGDPIGSKFLHSLEEMDYAPSTLRKYLNNLEKSGLVYQPYNSSGRIPTIQGIAHYIDEIMEQKATKDELNEIEFDLDYSRNGLRFIVETLGNLVDGVVTGFLRNDEYFFLGLNNILKNSTTEEYEMTKHLIEFIEQKKIIQILDEKIVKTQKIYYTFIEDDQKVLSCLYTKITVNNYEAIISIIGPLRVNYKKNLAILQKFLSGYH
ncbi:MAG TPA: hypothetical protein PKD96_00075 [Candidatus Absconditabacterales bacterium]|nr:hypothetical protein [Candidatus Absconditabacterales bacterium]HMT26678.1 hypothetical protein [Candidatus Absconditabacterales bacterium]